MSREVCNGQHFIAEGWNEQEIHLREHPGHLQSDLATEAVRLHEIYRREKTRLAEYVRPGIRHLHFEVA